MGKDKNFYDLGSWKFYGEFGNTKYTKYYNVVIWEE